ncbi:unnamed protein product [Oncorhynchus mykiss]|uniref:Sortilin C-terminal domain-containing protein n=1 Tax=Oncorhynchus mykiss TaxID=8022 RepID=A0A060YRI4_ONCMY|nr:unnamed protein product [Oncorhynchus mykiss]
MSSWSTAIGRSLGIRTQPERKEIDLSKRCVNDLLGPQELLTDGHLSSSTPIVVTVLIIILLSVVAGFLFVKKYVCGGRFLVHRYSVLQQHAEAQGDGVDEPLDSNHTRASNKTGLHDSDEDLLE